MISEPRLRRKLEAAGVDVLVASSPENVFHLSGLDSLSQDLLGEQAFAVRTVEGGGPHIVLPAVDASIVVDADLDYEQVYTYGSFYLYEGDDVSAADREVRSLVDERNYDDPTAALLAALEPVTEADHTVALERSGLSPEATETVTSELVADELRAAESLCADLRRVKSDEEVRRLRRAVEINERAILAAVEAVEAGMTERELASIYQQRLAAAGAEPLFTVVGFGSHGAYPHAVAGDRELAAGDLIRFDVGCSYENYASDIARTFAFRSADEELRRKYAVLDGSLDRAIDLLEDGVETATVFEGTLEYVRTEGADVFDSFDRNHVGHGIGLEVYDPPSLDPSPGRVAAGMVLCVEPPYYELGTGGIQVEDEVVVTSDGVDRLSECPDALRVVG